MTRRGFTLVELLIALVLMGIVSASVYQLLVSNQRIYRQQTQRIELNDNLRSAIAILPGELRELSANDPAGSDIIAMSESTITYKAMRNLYVVCAPAGGAPAVGPSLSLDTAVIGLRGLDPERDTLLIFADFDPTTPRDDQWLHANLVAASSGNNCSGGRPSINVTIGRNLLPTETVVEGSPVRGFEVQEIRKYVDASGSIWLGSRRYHKVSGWSGLQPVVGPLAGRGLAMAFFDTLGTATVLPADVARISFTVIARTSRPVETSTGTVDYLLDTLVTNVALRNNR